MENNKKIKKKNILQKFSERRFFVVSRRYLMTNKKWVYNQPL